ncbi:hypothetical protein SFRURICE_012244, partial [Spodoptera frugiperda]
MYSHAFYLRKNRQRCTLQRIMPLYNVHLLFTIRVISPIVRATTEKYFQKSPVMFCPIRESYPKYLA